MAQSQPNLFLVATTYKKRPMWFTIEARNSDKAVQIARQIAKGRGMKPIMMKWVMGIRRVKTELSEVAIPFLNLRGIRGDEIMGLEEIDTEILYMLGDDVDLKVVQGRGSLWLDDGESEPVNADDITALELTSLLYEWAVYAGLTCLNFAEYLDEAAEGVRS